MSVSNNLATARNVKDYVDKMMPIGANNKWGDVLNSSLASDIRDVSLFCVKFKRWLAEDTSHLGRLGEIRAMADRAKSWGCGNCNEQAAVAFVRLELIKFEPVHYGPLHGDARPCLRGACAGRWE